ncbi:hypothetical protein MMC11_008769 [Xylographa trunciseda]|nr:hypothetical protein [Xylographa trunciseda]
MSTYATDEVNLDMDTPSDWLQEHPHNAFQICMGAIERQSKAHKAMRLCPKRDVSNIDRAPESLHDGAMGCHCCWKKFEKNPTTYYCTKCSLSSCVDCHESGKLNHPHPQLIKLDMVMITPPSDFWRSVLEGNQRSCDECKDSFWPDIQIYMQCNRCKDFDICQDCLSKGSFSTAHASCPNPPGWTWYDHEKRDDAWLDEQIGIAKAHKAEEEAEAERRRQAEAERKRKADAAARAAASAAPAPQRTRVASTQGAQLKVTPAPLSRIRAPSPAPPRTSSSRLAPAPQKTAQRRKSSSGLGSALLSFGKAVLNAEVSSMNAANNNGFGGGGGGGTVNFGSNAGDSGGMNMNSFWQPINDAASSPIQ